MKTLVVDNNPVILKAVSTILSQEGCSVKEAATGLEALAILDEYVPEIIFTDLVMPLVSGEQLCRIIKNTEKFQNIFIVVLSGIVLEDRERILQDVECDVCIAKGSLAELRQHIKQALQSYHKKKTSVSSRSKKDTHIPTGLVPSEVARELLLEKQHHANIVSNLDEGIIELSQDGKIVRANRAALELLSCREEILLGKLLPTAIDWGDFKKDLQLWTEQQLINRGMAGLEILENAPLIIDERIIVASFIPVDEGETVFGICIFRDISRQYKAEKHSKKLADAIRLVKKMDAMSCMAGGVAHDFNNLLTVICGNLDILSLNDEKNSDNGHKLLIEQAKKAALVAVDLTRQISCFSNFGIVKRETLSADLFIKNAVTDCFGDDSESYVLSGSSEGCYLSVDPEEITSAICNIVQNSREALPGGEIRLSITAITLLKPELIVGQYVSAGEYVRIDIKDFGPGIEKDNLFRIFDPYYSTKERGASKGMGLGLTVVYATVRNHGGNVVVQSTINEGTTVSLYLPVFTDSLPSQIIFPKEDPTDRPLLLVDPDVQMLQIGKIMLSHLGFNVDTASDRETALGALECSIEESEKGIPLVVLDLSDSNGESAVETCRQMKTRVEGLKVVAMSGTILDPVMENCYEYGFDNTLPKPYTIDSLRHIIHTVLAN